MGANAPPHSPMNVVYAIRGMSCPLHARTIRVCALFPRDGSKSHANRTTGASGVLQAPYGPTLWQSSDDAPPLWTSAWPEGVSLKIREVRIRRQMREAWLHPFMQLSLSRFMGGCCRAVDVFAECEAETASMFFLH